VDPYHHGMALTQVADRGTVSDMEGSCEYMEYVFPDNRQGVILHLGVLILVLKTPHRQNISCYEMVSQKA